MDETGEFCFVWSKGKKQKQYKGDNGEFTCFECGYKEKDDNAFKKHCEDHRDTSEITRSDTRRRKRSKTTTELRQIIEPQQQQQQQQTLLTHAESNEPPGVTVAAAIDTATPAAAASHVNEDLAAAAASIANNGPATITPTTSVIPDDEAALNSNPLLPLSHDTTPTPPKDTAKTTIPFAASPLDASQLSFLFQSPNLTPTQTPSAVVAQPRYFTSHGGRNILTTSTWSAIKEILGKRSLGDHALELAEVITIIERGFPNVLLLITPPAKELDVLTMLPAAMGREGITVVVTEYFLNSFDLIEGEEDDEMGDGETVTWKSNVTVLQHKRIMLVQLKDVGTAPFLKTCEKLARDHRLEQIVVKDCHLLVHSSQKQAESMRNAGIFLAKLHHHQLTRLILLSNHLPLYAEHALRKIVPVPTWQVVRTSVARPNIQITVKHELAIDLTFERRYRKLSFEVEAMRKLYPSKKGIVFVPKGEVSRVATKLNLKGVIPGHMELWHQQRTLWEWTKEEDEPASAVLVAPYGSLSSIKREDVAFCVHLNEPPNILDLACDLATLQRSGDVGSCSILIPQGSARSALKGYEDYVYQSGQQAIWRFVDFTSCRQLTLGHELSDGFGMECLLLGGELCDLCKERLGEEEEDVQGVEEAMQLIDIGSGLEDEAEEPAAEKATEERAVEEPAEERATVEELAPENEQITLRIASSPPAAIQGEDVEIAGAKRTPTAGVAVERGVASGREMAMRKLLGSGGSGKGSVTRMETPTREQPQRRQEQPQQQKLPQQMVPQQIVPQQQKLPQQQMVPQQKLLKQQQQQQKQQPPQKQTKSKARRTLQLPPTAGDFFKLVKAVNPGCGVCFLDGADYNHPVCDCDSPALSDGGLHTLRTEYRKAMGVQQGWLGCYNCSLPMKHCLKASENDPIKKQGMVCEFPNVISLALWGLLFNKDSCLPSDMNFSKDKIDEFSKWAALPADNIWFNKKCNKGFHLAVSALWGEWKKRGKA